MQHAEEITITYAVPYDGAVETMRMTSTVSYAQFRERIAEEMKTPLKDLHVSYRLSSEPKSGPLHHLSKPLHYLELI